MIVQNAGSAFSILLKSTSLTFAIMRIPTKISAGAATITSPAEDDDEDVIMPTEPPARPHKSIDIDIAVDD